MNSSYHRNRAIMWLMFVVLVVLHHDWWYWNDGTLLLGFLPIGLGYQMLISLAASALWGWAAFYAWPDQYDQLTARQGPSDTPTH